MDRGRIRMLLRASILVNVFAFFFLYQASKTSNPIPFYSSNLPREVDGDPLSSNSHHAGMGARSNHAGIGAQEAWSNGIQTVQPQCGMCEADPALCEKLGLSAIMKSIGYSGSNQRLRRVLQKMRNGEPFTIGAVGGSVSKGHGLQSHNDAYAPKNMHRVIFDHLNNLFPASGGTIQGQSGKSEMKNALINGAQGGVGTDYFSMCFSEHIPEDVDLVFIELAINDELLPRNMETYEYLVRGLMDLPNKPAIININVFALMFATIANGGDLHTGFAQFYDIPIISLRHALLHQVLANGTMVRDLFVHDNSNNPNNANGIDLRHIGPDTHVLVGNMVNAYLDWQLCEIARIEAREGTSDPDVLFPIEPLPRMRLLQKYDPDSITPKISPNCFSANAQKNKLVPSSNDGWREWNWKEKKYIIADVPGSKISFDFTTSIGIVKLFYLRSAQYKLGSAECWVDDDRHRSLRIEGYWKEIYNIGRSIDVRTDLAPGKHQLHCELMQATADPTGGHEFRIISVMSI